MDFNRKSVIQASVFLILLLLSACGGSVSGSGVENPPGPGPTPPPVTDTISVLVAPGEFQVHTSESFGPLTAYVTGSSNTDVDWSIQDMNGTPTTSGGTLAVTGPQTVTYTAPQSEREFLVVAASRANPQAVGSARVTVLPTGTPLPPASCDAEPIRTTGAVHYYCDCQAGADASCQTGDDTPTNLGTDPAHPRVSLTGTNGAFARFNQISAGDTVALCRGGAWNPSSTTSPQNTRCTTSATCDLRDYYPSWATPGVTARPIVNLGSNGFSIGGTTNHGGYRFMNLDLRADGSSIYFVNDPGPHDIDWCNISFSGQNGAGRVGIVVERNTRLSASGLKIRHSQFKEFGFTGIFGGAGGLVIENNVFTNNGLGGTPQDHSLYLFRMNATDGDGMTIQNNDFVTDGRCGGVMVTAHAHMHDVRLTNNRITTTSTNPNCYGYQNAVGINGANMRNFTITRNRIFTPHTQGMEISETHGAVVSDNVIVTGGTGISVGTPNSDNVVVMNNTIIVTGGGSGLGQGSTASNNSAVNNVFFLNSNSACFNLNGVALVQDLNNYCRRSGGASLTALFANPTANDYRPNPLGPLVGFGNSTTYSPVAIGTAPWSPADVGAPRSPPINAGAF